MSLSAYEIERAETILKNNKVLVDLGLCTSVAVSTSVTSKKKKVCGAKKSQQLGLLGLGSGVSLRPKRKIVYTSDSCSEDVGPEYVYEEENDDDEFEELEAGDLLNDLREYSVCRSHSNPFGINTFTSARLDVSVVNEISQASSAPQIPVSQLAQTKSKVQCPECKRWFTSIASGMIKQHNTSVTLSDSSVIRTTCKGVDNSPV